MSRQAPIRTCIGCRQRAAATELFRIVAAPGERTAGNSTVSIVPDLRRREPGRGAWLHRDQACVDLAQRRRAFARALRVAGKIDPDAVGEYVSQAEHSTIG